MAGKPNDKMFKTMVEKHGGEEAAREWFSSIGRRGGSVKGTQGGFAHPSANPSLAGAKAGRISKRGHKYIETKGEYNYYIALDTGNVVKYKHDNNSKEQTSADR